MEPDGNLKWTCHVCGDNSFDDGSTDGFFYCLTCGAQAQGIVDTATADEDFVGKDGDNRGGIYLHSNSRAAPIKAEPLSQGEPIASYRSQSQFWNSLPIAAAGTSGVKEEEDDDGGGVGPTEPSDFGGSVPCFDDYYSELRMKYVMGIQLMIQMQCEALVEKFKVSPLICGLSGTIWLRFVASTGVFEDEWAEETIHASESQKLEDQGEIKSARRHTSEPLNIYGQRAVLIWYKSLTDRIPLSCSLSICFLCCHVAREPILPTDILKWSLDGELPYLAAFIDIEKKIGPPSIACPLSSSFLFRPSHLVPLQKLESMAASIAQSIGLNLPPVNFYAIASRYLKQLSLPLEKILPHACRIHEWLMPPDLWLSTNELRHPTRVCVMSMLIIAIRILYNLHGFGFWEKSLCKLNSSSATSNLQVDEDSEVMDHDSLLNDSEGVRIQMPESEIVKLLHNLHENYNEIGDASDYSKDLATYLQYCKHVVFAGLEPSYDDKEEKKITDELWTFYQNHKGSDPNKDQDFCTPFNLKRSKNDEGFPILITKENKKVKSKRSNSDNCKFESPRGDSEEGDLEGDSEEAYSPSSEYSEEGYLDSKKLAINRLKENMKKNEFCYMPPRINIKRLDYLLYVRKKDDNYMTYAAHADYYILLRSCAKVAQVDIRILHVGVLSLERRLAWTECQIDHSIRLQLPEVPCEFCSNPQQSAPHVK